MLVEKEVLAGLFREGTAKKAFSEKSQYYQSLYTIIALSETFCALYMDAFEDQLQSDEWKEEIGKVLNQMKASSVSADHIDDIQPQLAELRHEMECFEDKLKDKPTAMLWLTFLKMVDNLQRFLYHECEGNWQGYLSEAANMLPYLAAAGHL